MEEREGGREGHKERETRERREERRRKNTRKKKNLTDSAHAAQHAAAEGMGRRSPAPLCFTCFLTHRTIPTYLWEESSGFSAG